MKSMYEKPYINVTTVYTEPILASTLEHGVIGQGDDMAKNTDIVEEETGIPSNFSNIWGDEEDKD